MLRVSWTSLQNHMKCKQRGYLHRQGGRRNKLADTRGFFPGTVTDRVVREYLDQHGEADMPSMVSSIIDREESNIKNAGQVMKWKNLDDRKQVEKDCIEAVTKIEPLLLKWVLPFDYTADYRFEVPVNVPHPSGGIEQILLIGAMDILVRDARGDFMVWDVKHTRDENYWRKTQGQLSFYDFVIRLQEGKATRMAGLLQPLCKEQLKPIPIDADFSRQIQTSISTMATDVFLENKEPRQDSKECYYCDVRHACEKFKPKVVNGKKRVSFSK